MTLKTSLFNKGIYKSTVKRCFWGAVLYFIILLIGNVLPIVLMGDYHSGRDIILDNGLVFGSVILSMFVPTAVALLVFRYIHSKKTSIFTHSLPVTRNSVFVSSLAGAFTLMFVPVLLCGIILLLMALTGYAYCMTVVSCLTWTGMNLLALFLMFSCACISAHLTGNTFGAIAINGLLHAIVPLVTVAVNAVAECFLYGFKNMNEVISDVVYSNFVVWLGRSADNISYNYYAGVTGNRQFEFGSMFVYIAIAVLFYILSWVLYKVRNLENAEDVAAFKCLNPIFKYLVTFLASISSFALFCELLCYSVGWLIVAVAVVTAVAYFGAEMLLKKTLKVWRAYRGFLIFCAGFTALMCFTAFTSFFGFEKYVPDASNIESVSVYGYYQYDEPFSEDSEFAECVTNWHRSFLDEKQGIILDPSMSGGYYQRINIVYKLSNGKTVERTYYLSEAEKYQAFEGFYEFKDYKLDSYELFNKNPENLYSMSLYSDQGVSKTIQTQKHRKQLYECLYKDVTELGYGQIYTSTLGNVYINIEFKNPDFVPGMGGSAISYFSCSLNRNFKNTYKWLKDNGYGECIQVVNENSPLYIVYDMDFSIGWKVYSDNAVEFDGTISEKTAVTDEEMKERVYDYLDESYFVYKPGDKHYTIFAPDNEFTYSIVGNVSEEDIKDFEAFLNK